MMKQMRIQNVGERAMLTSIVLDKKGSRLMSALGQKRRFGKGQNGWIDRTGHNSPRMPVFDDNRSVPVSRSTQVELRQIYIAAPGALQRVSGS